MITRTRPPKFGNIERYTCHSSDIAELDAKECAVGSTALIWDTGDICLFTGDAWEVVGAEAIDTAALSTTEKSSLVAAINEVNSQLTEVKKLTPLGSGIDDTAQIQNAIDSMKNGGKIELSGTFNVNANGIDIKSNISLIGFGGAKLLGDGYILSANKGDGGTPDVADNFKNVTIEGITFEHITKTFSQHTHLLNLNAISDIEISRCCFVGFRGDGVYLGSSNAAETERHNQNIIIRECIFDGVNYTNRNAISVIDANGLVIENNIFKNCTASDMPGAVTIEPDSGNDFAIIRNITIKNNRFYSVGGNVGAINVYLPLSQSTLTNPANNIVIENNIIDTTINNQGAIVIQQKNAANIIDNTAPIDAKILNNVAKNVVYQALTLRGIRGVSVVNNQFADCGSVYLGYNETGDNIKDVVFANNTIDRLTNMTGVNVFTADRLAIRDNMFVDCGKPDGTFGYALDFNTGVSSYVTLDGNKILSPNGKTTYAIQKEGSHTFDRATNIYRNNQLIGVTGQAFQADLIDPVDLVKIGSITASTLPDSIAVGVTEAIINGADANLPTGITQGVLIAHKLTNVEGYRKFTVEFFYPANNSATSNTSFYRQANDGENSWNSWTPVNRSYLTSISSNPEFVGQEALVAGIWYKAKGVSATSDWVALNV